MTVYHGSFEEISNPDIFHSRKKVDFGAGFYVTPLNEQAVSWSRRFIPRHGKAVVSRYELDDAALQLCRTLRFDSYSEEWLDFIVACRQGIAMGDYDIVMGGVANDRVFDTLELFFNGLIGKSDAIEKLKFFQPNYQICIRTQNTIEEYLHFIGSETI